MEEEKRKILMIIAFRDFRDEEYFIPKQILKGEGFKIVTASTSAGTAVGKMGGEAKIDITLNRVRADDYEAILFIGGSGAAKLMGNDDCNRLSNEAINKNKVLGAICIAPTILAYAGILSGKKATVWSSNMDKSAIKILKDSGANYLAEAVVSDGKIITGAGPFAAKEFAETIIDKIKNN